MGSTFGAAVPILLLIGIGYLSWTLHLFRTGDERVLNGYIYWLALPALFLDDLSRSTLTADTVRFMGVGAIPVLALTVLLLVLPRVPRDLRYLLAVSTSFGSLAFFGIPFAEFALGPGEPVRLASLAVAGIAPFTVALALVLLETYRAEELARWAAAKAIFVRLLRNPLILSIALGVGLSLSGVRIPAVLATPLSMLGRTAAPLALVTLGVFFYRRDYRSLLPAFGLSLTRLVLLPCLTLLAVRLAGLPALEGSVLVIMNGTPIAVNTIVLSERYRFHQERIAPLILVSSLGAVITLDLWLFAVRSILGG